MKRPLDKSGDGRPQKTTLTSEDGMITLDFIFAFMVAVGFFGIFFMMAVSLSLFETAQYVTFATSRAYMGAHENKTLQGDLGKKKFDELMAKPAIKTFLGQNWMKVSPPQLGDFTSEYPSPADKDNDIFVGARIPVEAKLLNLRVPFLGPTIEESGVGKAVLNSYLMREVTTEECREQFNRQRYNKLRALSSGGGGVYSSAGGEAKLITDNGC